MKNRKIPSGRKIAARVLGTSLILAMAIAYMTVPAMAATLQESNVFTGLKALLNDALAIAVVLCPLVGGAVAVFCLIRRSMADEQDGKMWMKRMYVAIGCGVGGCLVSGLISLLISYFM